MMNKDKQGNPSAIAGLAAAICCSMVWLGGGVVLLLIRTGAA